MLINYTELNKCEPKKSIGKLSDTIINKTTKVITLLQLATRDKYYWPPYPLAFFILQPHTFKQSHIWKTNT